VTGLPPGVAHLRVRAATAYRQWTARQRMLPVFLMIGAQRSGTSTLYQSIGDHPGILPAAAKEIHFFDLNFAQGLRWYRAYFPLQRSAARARAQGWQPVITGEASPYYLFHPLAAERAGAILPDAKLIAILRNPIDRGYSHYHKQLRAKRETLSFEEAVDAEPTRLAGEFERLRTVAGYRSKSHRWFSYLSRDHYLEQLQRWTQHYPRERLLVVSSEEYYRQPQAVFDQIFDFLQVPRVSLPGHQPSVASAPGYPKMNPDTRARLVEQFRPLNERLYEFVGRDFGWDR
jgi:hypothetical protein